VLSLKSSESSREELADREEVSENQQLINEYFSDPYSHSLKKLFKLKRIRKDDKSCDSSSMMSRLERKEEDAFE
jgi:hypothetical protein